MQVLILLTKADGAIVTRDTLNEACWDGRIVGEDAINRVISRLRRLAEGLGQGVFHIETVTGVGYRLVAETSSDLAPEAPARAAPSRRPAWSIAAAALLVALLLAGGWWMARPPGHAAIAAGPKAIPRLRVDAFAPLSPDVSPAMVASAREEIVAAFGQISLVDIDANPADAAASPLSWRLSGAIGRAGPNLRFIVHLTHESTGQVVWSATMERPAGEGALAFKRVAAMIEEVVATSLAAAASYHGGALPDPTLALFIQWNQDTVLPVARYRHGEEELRRALALTPDFATGWSWLAGALGATASASPDPADAAAARAAAPAVIARALSYNSNDPIALMARAKILPPGDFLGRDAAFVRATTAPSSEFGAEHSAYAVFLINVGRPGVAVRQADISHELDPIYPGFMTRYAEALSLTGQSTLARRVIDQARALWPEDESARDLIVRSALWTGDYDPAVAALRADVQTPPAVREVMLETLAALQANDPARQDAAAARLIRLSLDPGPQGRFVVSALGRLGRDREAIAAADRLIAARNALTAGVLFDPTLAAARRTPEFAALVVKVGLLDYWRRSGHPPDFCLADGAPALCAGLKGAAR